MNLHVRFSSYIKLGMIALPIVYLSGCGKVYDAEVSGVVSLDGELLPRGNVSFNPSNPGPTSYGVIREDGSYFVQTGREIGIPSGDYTVTVIAKEEVIVDPNSSVPPEVGKTITPPWYLSKKSSNLKITVESGSNEIDIALSSEPPPDWIAPKSRRRRGR